MVRSGEDPVDALMAVLIVGVGGGIASFVLLASRLGSPLTAQLVKRFEVRADHAVVLVPIGLSIVLTLLLLGEL